MIKENWNNETEKKFNIKEFILSVLSELKNPVVLCDYFRSIFFFNFYLAQNNLAVPQQGNWYSLTICQFLGILFGISFLLIVPILSSSILKKWFPFKLVVSYLVYNTLSYLTEAAYEKRTRLAGN